MRKSLFFNAFLLTFTLIFNGCINNKNNHESKNIELSKTESQQIQSGTFVIDQEKSNIEWIGSKPTGSHDGTIQVQKATITTNEDGHITAGKFILDMTSINCVDLADHPKKKESIENHLKDPDFFDTEKHPTSLFIIKHVGNEKISGTLTIKGISKDISFNYVTDRNLSYKAEIIIDRTLFDIKYKSKSIFPNIGDHFIHDEFIIKLNPIVFK